jgi:7,8-didemethyl-8-hydroxy-5-deazariboflavin synthase CofG subunit
MKSHDDIGCRRLCYFAAFVDTKGDQTRTAVHEMPRIGPARALKWALEGFWAGTVSAEELDVVAASIWRNNWQTVANANANAHLGFIPSNDFSLYDHVLDTAVMVGAIPMRFASGGLAADPERYVAMARGGNVDGKPVLSLDLTKWFDTNYHHLVHELDSNSVFVPDATKVTRELSEAAALGIHTTPVLLDPLTLALRIAPMRAGTLCRDRCHYCTFVDTPAKLVTEGLPPYLSEEQVLAIALRGARLGGKEALFTLGDRPEDRWDLARRWLEDHGFASTLEYVGHLARRITAETGLLAHLNPGVMSLDELRALRATAPSMGMMLETTSRTIFEERGGAHFGSPYKDPQVRLADLENAGRAKVPFTTGLLIGIGESLEDWAESMIALHGAHEQHGHVQEVIIQNFGAKPTTAMQGADNAGRDEYLAAVATARVVLGPDMCIQAPPNLSDPSGPHQPSHHSSAVGARTELVRRAAADPSGLTDADYVQLLRSRGGKLDRLAALADDLRRSVVGATVSLVVNRNLNSNLCSDPDLVAQVAADAWDLGATELCIQGTTPADTPADIYEQVAAAVKRGAPRLHLHAFRPVDVLDGARRTGRSLGDHLRVLAGAGVDTVPGTGVKILDEAYRARAFPNDVPIDQWLESITAAHAVGLRSTSVMFYGHGETLGQRVDHLRRLRAIQSETGGFTEFVPMPLPGNEPDLNEARAVHAVARLILHGSINHHQAAWTRLGLDGATAALRSGADDLGGTLLDGRVLPEAGVEFGRELPVETAHRIAKTLGRTLRLRTTTYGDVDQ